MTRKPPQSAGRPEPGPGPRRIRSGTHRARRVAPGAWQGRGFYVWDEDEVEVERWAHTLAQVLPAREEARR